MTRLPFPLGTTSPAVHTLPRPAEDPGEHQVRGPTHLWTRNLVLTWDNTIMSTIPNSYYSYRTMNITKQYKTKAVDCAYPG